MNSLIVLIAIQILVSVLIVVWVRVKVVRSLDDGDSIAKIRREIGSLIVELDGSADRNITVFEDRLRELKDCIAEADKRIVMLSNERARSWTPTSVPTPVPTPVPTSVPTPVPTPVPLQQASVQPVQAPLPQKQPLDAYHAVSNRQQKQILQPDVTTTQESTQAASVPFIRFSDKPIVFEEPFTERVARLHKRGFSSDIIAAKLKATIAEVDLALAAGGNLPEGRGEG